MILACRDPETAAHIATGLMLRHVNRTGHRSVCHDVDAECIDCRWTVIHRNAYVEARAWRPVISRAVFWDSGKVGEVRLTAAGTIDFAVPIELQRTLESLVVKEPDTKRRLTPEGEPDAWLRALPRVFRQRYIVEVTD